MGSGQCYLLIIDTGIVDKGGPGGRLSGGRDSFWEGLLDLCLCEWSEELRGGHQREGACRTPMQIEGQGWHPLRCYTSLVYVLGTMVYGIYSVL